MYRKSLDGVRAFCVVFTVFNHIRGVPFYIVGNFGVDIFFALSGFLITYLLVSEGRGQRNIDINGFYIRRAFRILPLYFITIILYFVATLVPGAHKSGEEFFHSFGYLVSIIPEYGPGNGLFGHAWTLGIEEKFYLLWPMALFLITLTGRKVIILLACMVIATALVILSSSPENLVRGYFGLSFGAIIAVATLKMQSMRSVLARLPLAAYALGGIVLCYVALVFSHSFIFNICIAAFAAVMVASLWQNERQIISKILSLSAISFFGRLTYAMYLTHVLVMNLVLMVLGRLKVPPQFLLVFALTYIGTAIFAGMLHAWVEVPLINIGRQLAKRSNYDQLVASDPVGTDEKAGSSPASEAATPAIRPETRT